MASLQAAGSSDESSEDELDLDALRRETHARLFGASPGRGAKGRADEAGGKGDAPLGDMSTAGISALEARLNGSPRKKTLVGIGKDDLED